MPRALAAFLVLGLLAGCASSEAKPARSAGAAPGTLYNEPSPSEQDKQDAAEQEAVMRSAQIRISTVIGQALRLGAAVWLTNHTSCPQPNELIAAHVVSAQLRADDAWDTAYRVECPAKGPVVISAGPDKVFGTPDDIVVGR